MYVEREYINVCLKINIYWNILVDLVVLTVHFN